MTRPAPQPVPPPAAPEAARTAPNAGSPAQREALEGLKLALLARKRLLVLTDAEHTDSERPCAEPRRAVFERLTAEVAADGALVLAVAAGTGMDVETLVATAGAAALADRPVPADFDTLVDELERRLDLAGSGLLAVDDAHRLGPATLADLAELSRSATAQGRFLQILLSGPAELERALTHPSLAAALRDHGVIYRLAGSVAAAAPAGTVAGTAAGLVAPARAEPRTARPARTRTPVRRAVWPWAAGVALVAGIGTAAATLGPAADPARLATEVGDAAERARTAAAEAWSDARAFVLNQRGRAAAPDHADPVPAEPMHAESVHTQPAPADSAPVLAAAAPAEAAPAAPAVEAPSVEAPSVKEPEPPAAIQTAQAPLPEPATEPVAEPEPAPPPAARTTPPARPDPLASLLNRLPDVIASVPPDSAADSPPDTGSDVAGAPVPADDPFADGIAALDGPGMPIPLIDPPVAVAALPAVPAPPEAPAPDPAVAAEVAALLDRARAQIDAKKLTTPEGDNAFETVLAIRTLSPRAPEADALTAEMVDIYRRWAAMARDRGDWRNARLFYERALVIAPDDGELTVLLDEALSRTGGAGIAAGRPDAMPAVLRDVLSRGMPADTRLADGKTPLMLAAEHGLLDAARHLLQRGANPGARTGSGATPLMYAAYAGHAELVGLLAASGADVNAANVDGKTALMAAAARGHTGVVRTLLARGASVDRPTRHGWTALMYAANAGHGEVARVLVAGGADPRHTDGLGNSAVTLGRDHGHYRVVEAMGIR
ncbi:ankyrin repeat domain-containing protein [Azospirillum halopraeferens]|uniref:ankyrin repeat domain-containing protein n=1 Tax=Azospirillum halopraeferens TaxID=34010 RepID=UPI0004213BF5|nr:ankyrin repeat domain-containing protein [Azospirillum halopraeferens]